jgi:hypothetical protein
MTYTDHAAEARSNSRRAAAATRRAKRDAQEAERFYLLAAELRRQAAWLTGRPSLWDESYTPAELERRARSWTRNGDTYLRGSFRADDSAVFYKGIAASYRKMAASHAAWMSAALV